MTAAEAVERATRIVAAWPAWKRGILAAGSRPEVATPRKPVDNRTRHAA